MAIPKELQGTMVLAMTGENFMMECIANTETSSGRIGILTMFQKEMSQGLA